VNAELLVRSRVEFAEDLHAEIVLWRVPTPVRGSTHEYKYRFALIHRGICVLRYDNEAGKGDHRHIGNRELPYVFTTREALERDFEADIALYRGEIR
jgi:hypothetical protein